MPLPIVDVAPHLELHKMREHQKIAKHQMEANRFHFFVQKSLEFPGFFL